MTRTERVRLSTREKRLAEMLKELEYEGDHVPLAVPIADAVEAAIVRRQGGDGDGEVVL